MDKPRICAVIASYDPEAVEQIEPLVDLFEVRIDLIGDGWQDLAGKLSKPWIACNRISSEGGKWAGTEAGRIEKLLQAMELGADIIDIELSTKNLDKILPPIKKRTKCLLSSHNLEKTPPLKEMKDIAQQQLKWGADICKIVTTAQRFEDNLTNLELISAFPGERLVSFAMGPLGSVSRVISPLLGADFTYASIKPGKESAPGQIAVKDLITIYQMLYPKRYKPGS